MVEVTLRSSPSRSRGPIPGVRDARRPFATSPFARLARTHALGTGGDALFGIALAGTIFFQLDFDQARTRTALYLLLTIAPFAVAAPLIGPALDRVRGGRRWVIAGCQVSRVIVCFLIIRHLDSLLFYPEAFAMLVLGKVYSISKSALVPTTVRSDKELVEANSKLTMLSAIAVVVVAPFGGLLLRLGDSPTWPLTLAMVVFIGAAITAFQLPPARVASQPPGEAERMELRAAGIFLAASAMGLLRAIVGFLLFMLAFYFKDLGLVQLGIAAGAAQVGFFIGAFLAPHLRRATTEERMLVGSLAVVFVAAVVCTLVGGLVGAAVLSFVVGGTSTTGKQAFDAIVQRDAPDANRGRSFARFETRFQLFWVIGALIPIVIPIPIELGFAIIAAVASFALISYLVGVSQIRSGGIPRGPRKRRARRPGPIAPPAGPPPPNGPAATESTGELPREPGARRWAARGSADPTTTAGAGVRDDDRTTLGWEPPPGFVAQRLIDDEGTVAGGADDAVLAPSSPFDGAAFFDEHPPEPPSPTPPPPSSPGPGGPPSADPLASARPMPIEQPQLPLEVPGAEATIEYPEPPWRNAGPPDPDG
jgi:hypothetical protein